MSYQVGIDLGTTYTAAAVYQDGRASIFSLGGRSASIPSVVLLREDETVLTGEAAVRRAVTEPERVAREFKRRLGDTTPIIVGGTPYSAEALMSRLLRHVLDEVAAREGSQPDQIAVCHPANWGEYKHDLLRQAIQMANLDASSVLLLTEPEAAVISYASQERVDPGEVVAVYDLGGGTFDAAVLRRTDNGFEIIGKPEGIERLGGIDFDAAVFAHVTRALDGAIEELDHDDPATISAVARLRQDCVDAKEALSSDTDATIPVLLPGLQTEVRITRSEFEGLIRPSLVDSIDAMHRALRSAGVGPTDVARVLLVGGSSRVPLIAQMVSSELGRPVAVDAHPKHAVALGAAVAAAGPSALGGSASGEAAPAASDAVTPVPVVVPPPAAEPVVPPPVAEPVVPPPVAEPVVPPPVAEPVVAAPPAAEPVAVPPPVAEPPPMAPPAAASAPPTLDAPLGASVAPGGQAAVPAPVAHAASSAPAPVPVEGSALPPDVGPASTSGSGGGSRLPLLAAIGVVVVVVLALGGFLLSRGGGDDTAADDTATDDTAAEGGTDDEGSDGTTTSEAVTTSEAPRTDADIAADVEAATAAFGLDDLEVLFQDSTVTLTGTALDEENKTAIVGAVSAVPGVETVNADNLGVLPEAFRCTDLIQSQVRWLCIDTVEFDGSTLTATFESEDGGEIFNTGGGFHVHFFDGDLHQPITAGLNGDASVGGGDWQVWDLTPTYSTTKFAGTDIQMLCGRIATSFHTLESLDSGNCWPVTVVDPG